MFLWKEMAVITDCHWGIELWGKQRTYITPMFPSEPFSYKNTFFTSSHNIILNIVILNKGTGQ